MAGFYKEFMAALHAGLEEEMAKNAAVLAFSYIGHEAENPSHFATEETYGLEDQILHKMELIDQLIPPSARVVLIGHSIGCKLIMEIAKRNTTHNFTGFYFLFPTIENMADTRRGIQIRPLLRFRKLVVFLVTLLYWLLPRRLLEILLQRQQKTSRPLSQIAAQLANPNAVNNCLSLATEELAVVLDLDTPAIASMADRLKVYYGEDDGWCPLAHRDNILMVQGMREERALIDRHGTTHDFVLQYGSQMGRRIADWHKTQD